MLSLEYYRKNKILGVKKKLVTLFIANNILLGSPITFKLW